MLTVSDEVKPPWIVQMIFKHVVARLRLDCMATVTLGEGDLLSLSDVNCTRLPNWPLSPIKSAAPGAYKCS